MAAGQANTHVPYVPVEAQLIYCGSELCFDSCPDWMTQCQASACQQCTVLMAGASLLWDQIDVTGHV